MCNRSSKGYLIISDGFTGHGKCANDESEVVVLKFVEIIASQTRIFPVHKDRAIFDNRSIFS